MTIACEPFICIIESLLQGRIVKAEALAKKCSESIHAPPSGNFSKLYNNHRTSAASLPLNFQSNLELCVVKSLSSYFCFWRMSTPTQKIMHFEKLVFGNRKKTCWFVTLNNHQRHLPDLSQIINNGAKCSKNLNFRAKNQTLKKLDNFYWFLYSVLV